MPCEPIPGGFVCSGRIPVRVICDVCDKRMRKGTPKLTWRGRKVDVCPECSAKRTDPEWRAWAEQQLERNLEGANA